MSTSDDSSGRVITIERGRCYFWVRPKINTDNPTALNDFQQLLMIAAPLPDGSTNEEMAVAGIHQSRIIAFTALSLQRKNKLGRHWLFVEGVADSADQLNTYLKSERRIQLDNGTRGHMPVCRPLGEAVYEITCSPDRNSSFFSYKLVLPKEAGEPQKLFGIQTEATFRILVKNPHLKRTNEPKLFQSLEAAEFPKELQDCFVIPRRSVEARFCPIVDAAFLDHVNCELVLIDDEGPGRRDELLDIYKELETMAEAELQRETDMARDHRPERALLRELKMNRSRVPTSALNEGRIA